MSALQHMNPFSLLPTCRHIVLRLVGIASSNQTTKDNWPGRRTSALAFRLAEPGQRAAGDGPDECIGSDFNVFLASTFTARSLPLVADGKRCLTPV